MTRNETYNLLEKYITNKVLLKHSLATEAAMRTLANYFGEDEDLWGLVGLLHDADYQLSRGNPSKHGKILFEKEKDLQDELPKEVVHAIAAHNYLYNHVQPESKMDWAIACCDELTGLIVAEANVLPSRKIHDVKVEYLMKRVRQKNFQKHAERTNIFLCDVKLKIPLIEFVTMTLTAMQHISADLGM
ncbi:MAG: HD domain-containing protein [Patescibacteria group bacterium]|nr:HD domain-containing protein [Patescibacteria group bacterium]